VEGIAIGVGLVVESALCAGAQTPDQSEETKRTLTQQFLDCVTSQAITIDDNLGRCRHCAWRGLALQGRGPCCGRVQSRQSERTGAQPSRWPGGFRN
jgi:hypothetical protein